MCLRMFIPTFSCVDIILKISLKNTDIRSETFKDVVDLSFYIS